MTTTNGNGQLPTSPLLTSIEAARYLRLVDQDATPDEAEKAIKTVHRLVQQGRLRPPRPGRQYCFAHYEVDRFIRAEIEAWPREATIPEGSRRPELVGPGPAVSHANKVPR